MKMTPGVLLMLAVLLMALVEAWIIGSSVRTAQRERADRAAVTAPVAPSPPPKTGVPTPPKGF